MPFNEVSHEAIEAAKLLIKASGDDIDREGLQETPVRFAKAWSFWTQGYHQDPADVMKVFDNPSLDQLVIVKDIEFYSMCEHHMAPFFGRVHIGYIPDGKVLGVSKFARLTQIYARRLQIQEKLTKQIADDIMKYLQPQGVGVVIEAEHLCMKSRGVQTQNSSMITSEMLGIFRDEAPLRQEFLRLIERK